MRNTKGLRRRKPFRPQLKRVLIVCEGAKTEPYYFEFFRKELRLSGVDIKICGEECGSDPTSVVKYAITYCKKEKDIDICFCVIDRDRHDNENFHTANTLARSFSASLNNSTFDLFVSDPCIEYWFILHFRYTRNPYVERIGMSRGDCAVNELRQLMGGNYQKSMSDIGSLLKPHLTTAMVNAERALRDAELTGAANPSTNLHVAIGKLLSLPT